MTDQVDPYDMIDPVDALVSVLPAESSVKVAPMLVQPDNIVSVIENLKMMIQVQLVQGQDIATIKAQLEWVMQTLQWMAGIFQGLSQVASMMPGKAGKIAQKMSQQVQDGQNNG